MYYCFLDANAALRIKDYNGKTIRQFNISSHQQTIVWNTNLVATGIYFYQLKTPDEILEFGKVVIIK